MMKFFRRETAPTPPVTPKPAPEKTASLQRPEVFHSLSEQDLAEIYHAATVKHVQQDECILEEGAECRALYLITNGTVRLTDTSGIYNVPLHKGDVFGALVVKDNRVNIYSAIALTPTTVMEITSQVASHFSARVQLMIYHKLHQLAVTHSDNMTKHSYAMQARSAQLSWYIRNMRSQTNAFITSEVFQQIIKNIPKLPKCAGSLSTKLLEDNVSTKEVTEAVQAEPALAAAILKTVNSAYYGLQEKVSSLHHAILYLGFQSVYQLILETSVKNILPHDDDYEAIRLHSYMISLIANEIAALSQRSKPLLNATVGILHDVGKIVTLLLKRKYPNIRDIIGMVDESKIGACLLRSWEFPDNILTIIEEQYTPEFAHPAHLPPEYKYELAVLYLAHVCYDILQGEKTSSTIFLDDYLALLDFAPFNVQEFYQLKLLPALLKNHKRLPEQIIKRLHEQSLAAEIAFGRVS